MQSQLAGDYVFSSRDVAKFVMSYDVVLGGTMTHGSGCWEWRRVNNRGRGIFCAGGGRCLASRASWIIFRGSIPGGKHVLHYCDNPRCVNPSHLWLGDHADNMADKKAKGRASRMPGEDHPLAKLTNEQVREIYELAKARELTQSEIGKKYGVTNCTVSNIVRGTQWASVSGFPA